MNRRRNYETGASNKLPAGRFNHQFGARRRNMRAMFAAIIWFALFGTLGFSPLQTAR
jgi:hypothetical protein